MQVFKEAAPLVFSRAPYFAVYVLMEMIDRDYFMRMTDFEAYEKAMLMTNQLELEEMLINQEEKVLKFVRYIEILPETDIRRQQGKKFADRVYSLDSYKAKYMNQSQQIFDHESQIYEEENVIDYQAAQSSAD